MPLQDRTNGTYAHSNAIIRAANNARRANENVPSEQHTIQSLNQERIALKSQIDAMEAILLKLQNRIEIHEERERNNGWHQVHHQGPGIPIITALRKKIEELENEINVVIEQRDHLNDESQRYWNERNNVEKVLSVIKEQEEFASTEMERLQKIIATQEQSEEDRWNAIINLTEQRKALAKQLNEMTTTSEKQQNYIDVLVAVLARQAEVRKDHGHQIEELKLLIEEHRDISVKQIGDQKRSARKAVQLQRETEQKLGKRKRGKACATECAKRIDKKIATLQQSIIKNKNDDEKYRQSQLTQMVQRMQSEKIYRSELMQRFKREKANNDDLEEKVHQQESQIKKLQNQAAAQDRELSQMYELNAMNYAWHVRNQQTEQVMEQHRQYQDSEIHRLNTCVSYQQTIINDAWRTQQSNLQVEAPEELQGLGSSVLIN